MGYTCQLEDLMRALFLSSKQRSRMDAYLLETVGPGGGVVVEFKSAAEAEALAKLQVGNGDQMHQMMKGIQEQMATMRGEMRQGFAAVLVEHQALKSAKERLEQMQGENLFKFLLEIDDRAFRIICAVLVTGDVAKAARALSLKDSTLRQVLTSWRRRGGIYLGLLELLRWRKRRRITGTVPFNEALLYDDGGKSSRESVMAEVLDGVLSMTEANWPDVCAELETLLRGQLGSLRAGTGCKT